MINLRVLQYPNIRYRATFRYCQFDATHPKHFEPGFQCENTECCSCEIMKQTRLWLNSCYDAQHRVCTAAETAGEFLFKFGF